MDAQIFDTAYQKIAIDPLAVAVILDTHQRVGGKLKNCLCTLLGTLNDDGSVNITDAFANHVIVSSDGEATEGAALPEKTHHDFMIQARQKVYARESVIGWGTTDLDGQRIQAISDWARQDHRASKFVSQKRLPSPIIVIVTPPSTTNDLSIKCFVKGPIGDCLLRPLPVTLMMLSQQSSKFSLHSFEDESTGGFPSAANANKRLAALSDVSVNKELLSKAIDRVQKSLEVAKAGAAGKLSPNIGREMYKIVTPPLPADLETIMNAEKEEGVLFEYMSLLAKIQFELANKLHLLYA